VTLGQWRSTGASVIRLSGPSGDGPDAAGYLFDWGAYKRTWTLAETLGSVGSVSVSVRASVSRLAVSLAAVAGGVSGASGVSVGSVWSVSTSA
jgi:hypothetical protein